MKIGTWPERLSRLIILEELAVAYYRHRKRETRWWQDVWLWCCYQIISGYPPGELDHLGPLFRAVEHPSSGKRTGDPVEEARQIIAETPDPLLAASALQRAGLLRAVREGIAPDTLKAHYLAEIVCDHERKLDQPRCSCSLVNLGWHPSVGEAVDAWIEHVAALAAVAVEDGFKAEWTIRVCRCGFPLGATLAAIRLKTCPDCGAATIPVEDVTRSVSVFLLDALE